ncbi:SCAN domain-containing protein 3 [Thelohanellus kitauei]|uniref:SCAN domain-containing protein 3 n=1 Tax=Thelohanellus kitauei TaxID=669202 RepID=A0A0C2JQJ4_THEKT|nr:SCAN domain-containing protein 3 [Thelohanellus kitauei]
MTVTQFIRIHGKSFDIKKKANEHCKSIVFASYEVPLLLARKKKPFTDAEEIKLTLKIAAGILDDKNCKKFDQIPLSNNTMTRRLEEVASDVYRQSQDHIKNCIFFSMAMDELNDISHTHQVAVFFKQLTITLLLLKNY